MRALARRIALRASEPDTLEREALPPLLAHLAQGQRASDATFAVLVVRIGRAGIADFDFDPLLERAVCAGGLERLRRALRKGDRMGALAADELVAVLPGLSGPEHAELAAARVLDAFADPLSIGGVDHALRLAIGIACWHTGIGSANDLVRDARVCARLAESKRARYHVQRVRSGESPPDARIEEALRTALQQNGMTLHYQPQIDLATGRPVAAEVLARWSDAAGQPVPPILFVELAERRGLLAQLTAWVVNTAMREHAILRELGHDIALGINISPLDLEEDDFPELIAHSLATWSMPPERVTLEITETKPLRDPQSALPTLARLKRVGVRLSVDDFGTGYSSLALLRQLPVDELKIDQQFVRGMLEAKGSLDIVRTTLDLASNFGLDTVAEGIEDLPTADALRAMGCKVGQGYAFARPAPLSGLIGWLDARVQRDAPGGASGDSATALASAPSAAHASALVKASPSARA